VEILFQSIESLTDTEQLNRSRLERHVIHLWGIDLNGPSHCLARCAQWLDKEEQHRAERLVREEDRQRYVLAHGGLRAVLSRYLGVNPSRVELCRDEVGKPFVTKKSQGQSLITFNMSHAHGRALIAVSMEQDVGVDLERIRPDVEVEKLSERYFAPSEHTSIVQLAEEQRAPRFFRYWVAKEAVLKAQGIGLQALHQCEILLGAEGFDAEVLVPEGSRLHNNWKVRLLSCDEGWEAAVAAQGKDWVARCPYRVESGFVSEEASRRSLKNF
jgi:4'-phosphopantetheinyl transferase